MHVLERAFNSNTNPCECFNFAPYLITETQFEMRNGSVAVEYFPARGDAARRDGGRLVRIHRPPIQGRLLLLQLRVGGGGHPPPGRPGRRHRVGGAEVLVAARLHGHAVAVAEPRVLQGGGFDRL